MSEEIKVKTFNYKDLFEHKICCQRHIFRFNIKEQMPKKVYTTLLNFCAAILDCNKNDLYFFHDYIGNEMVYRIMSAKSKEFKSKVNADK